MKKTILVMLVMLAGIAMKAQTITFTNNTNCTAYFNIGTSYPNWCYIQNFSTSMSLAPNSGPVTYDVTTIPWASSVGAPGAGFEYYRLSFYSYPLQGPYPPGCQPQSNTVGQTYCGFMSSRSISPSLACNTCTSVTAVWTNTGGGNVDIQFN